MLGAASRSNSTAMKFVFPDIYIKFMNDEERNRYAGHALRCSMGSLNIRDLAKSASRSWRLCQTMVSHATCSRSSPSRGAVDRDADGFGLSTGRTLAGGRRAYFACFSFTQTAPASTAVKQT